MLLPASSILSCRKQLLQMLLRVIKIHIYAQSANTRMGRAPRTANMAQEIDVEHHTSVWIVTHRSGRQCGRLSAKSRYVVAKPLEVVVFQ